MRKDNRKKRMRNLNSILLVVLILAIVGLYFRGCGDVTPVLVGDTIRERIINRDTLLISRDTVIYRTKEVKNLITEYRIETDTVLKIQICDSMAVKCDSLADQYKRQDSIFREQIVDYALLVSVQDTAIKSQESEIKKLRRRNRILIGLSAVLGIVAVVK